MSNATESHYEMDTLGETAQNTAKAQQDHSASRMGWTECGVGEVEPEQFHTPHLPTMALSRRSGIRLISHIAERKRVAGRTR